MFCYYCFLSIFDASINFMRCFPLMIKKKKKKKKTKNKNAESMDRFCKFEGVVSQKLDGVTEYVYLMFSRICLECYFLKHTPLTIVMEQLKLMLWKFVWQNV